MMDPALENLGWTEAQWNRICTAVTEEAQKARVAAQVLPVVGPEDGNTVAIPRFALTTPNYQIAAPQNRLAVDSNPTLNLTTISVNVHLRGHEVADPELRAALTMFRRAANYIARIEDALVFNGRSAGPNPAIVGMPAGVPLVFTISADGIAESGVFTGPPAGPPVIPPRQVGVAPVQGDALVTAIVDAIGALEGEGQLGPFACILSTSLFRVACTPNQNSLVMPRDRILPFLQGPLLRASGAIPGWGAVIALSANPVEIVSATEIGVQFVQKTLEPRCVFRVSERVALRVKEWGAIALFFEP
jgi:uncharacterized linocin/CFP29 family protein